MLRSWGVREKVSRVWQGPWGSRFCLAPRSEGLVKSVHALSLDIGHVRVGGQELLADQKRGRGNWVWLGYD